MNKEDIVIAELRNKAKLWDAEISNVNLVLELRDILASQVLLRNKNLPYKVIMFSWKLANRSLYNKLLYIILSTSGAKLVALANTKGKLTQDDIAIVTKWELTFWKRWRRFKVYQVNKEIKEVKTWLYNKRIEFPELNNIKFTMEIKG